MVNKSNLLTELEKAINSNKKTDELILKVNNLEHQRQINKVMLANRRAKNEQ